MAENALCMYCFNMASSDKVAEFVMLTVVSVDRMMPGFQHCVTCVHNIAM